MVMFARPIAPVDDACAHGNRARVIAILVAQATDDLDAERLSVADALRLVAATAWDAAHAADAWGAAQAAVASDAAR
jgi:hypothetical protein